MTQATETPSASPRWLAFTALCLGAVVLMFLAWNATAPRKPLVELNEVNWQEEVINSPIPVVVDFWAEWCGPCHEQTPILEQLAARYDGRITIGKVDFDKNPKLVEAYRITGIPSILMFKGKAQPRNSFRGLHSQEVLEYSIRALLAE